MEHRAHIVNPKNGKKTRKLKQSLKKKNKKETTDKAKIETTVMVASITVAF